MLVLDHLAIGCRDLDAGSRFTEALLGVPMASGGQHARYGTHNRLLSLGPDLYLEVIAPDGRIVRFHTGYVPGDERALEAAVREALGQAADSAS